MLHPRFPLMNPRPDCRPTIQRLGGLIKEIS
jgi:hypothetical protein